MINSTFIRIVGFAFLAFTTLSCLVPSTTLATDTASAQVFSLATDPIFSHPKTAFRAYARRTGARGNLDFCAVGFVEDSSRFVWVFWRHHHQLFLWEGQDLGIMSPRSDLDLRKDVVNSDSDLHGSTYKVTRAWVHALDARCRTDGTEVLVNQK